MTMDATGVTPRVSGKYLNKFTGRHVLLIVEVLETRSGDFASVRCSDGAEIIVSVQPGERFLSKFAQIIVKVINDQNNMGQVLSIEPVSDNFNMENYNKTVDMMNGQYSGLFV